MPVILTREDEEDWLNRELGADEAKALLVPYPAREMDAYEGHCQVVASAPRS